MLHCWHIHPGFALLTSCLVRLDLRVKSKISGGVSLKSRTNLRNSVVLFNLLRGWASELLSRNIRSPGEPGHHTHQHSLTSQHAERELVVGLIPSSSIKYLNRRRSCHEKDIKAVYFGRFSVTTISPLVVALGVTELVLTAWTSALAYTSATPQSELPRCQNPHASPQPRVG